MKGCIFVIVVCIFISVSTFSQNLFVNTGPQELGYEIKGRYARAIKPEEIKKAKSIGDLITGYPKNWISQYTSVEIIANFKGKETNAIAKSDKLSSEQLDLLSRLDVGNDLKVNIEYKYNDPVSKKTENNNMFVSLAVIPEIEASFYGGEKALSAYMRENVISKITQKIAKQFQRGLVTFTVNESGEVLNVKMKTSTGDLKSDALIMDLVSKMPRWKPAENLNGVKVQQNMQFSFGNDGC